MRQLTTLFVVALLVYSCGNSANEKADSDKDLVKVERADYSISFSKDWEDAPSKNPAVDLVLAAQPDGKTDRFSENINIMIHDAEDTMTLKKFEELTKIQLVELMPNSELIQSGIKKAKGNDYLEMEYKAPQNGYNLQFIQHVYIKNRKAYILTFTAEQSAIKEYRTMAQKVLSSFTLN